MTENSLQQRRSSSNPVEILNDDDEAFLLQHGSLEESLHYEELINPSRDSATCQTCGGLGRVPRERTNQLIALVPYNDERLKPKRTKCIFMSLIGTFLFLFVATSIFVLPRSVQFSENGSPVKNNATVDPLADHLSLDISSFYYIKNWNYYPVTVINCTMGIVYENFVITTVSLLNETFPAIKIAPREQKNITLNVDGIEFSDQNHLGFLALQCERPWKKFNKIPLQFQSTINVSYWYGHFELIQQSGYHFVSCDPTAIEEDAPAHSELILTHDDP